MLRWGGETYLRSNIGDIAVFCYMTICLVHPSEGKCVTSAYELKLYPNKACKMPEGIVCGVL
jgi:hypothetical protein